MAAIIGCAPENGSAPEAASADREIEEAPRGQAPHADDRAGTAHRLTSAELRRLVDNGLVITGALSPDIGAEYYYPDGTFVGCSDLINLGGSYFVEGDKLCARLPGGNYCREVFMTKDNSQASATASSLEPLHLPPHAVGLRAPLRMTEAACQ
jgi:hypothetical protein